MTTDHRLAVHPAEITHEAVRLHDGRMLAAEVSQPRPVYVVTHEAAGLVEILSSHQTEADAVAACKALSSEIERLAEGHRGRLN